VPFAGGGGIHWLDPGPVATPIPAAQIDKSCPERWPITYSLAFQKLMPSALLTPPGLEILRRRISVSSMQAATSVGHDQPRTVLLCGLTAGS
jgi:hypothetical protein